MDNTFVRSDMLPPQQPPLKEQGAIKWLRDNLFSGWLNSILTILGILAIFWLVKASLPWLLHSVWNASSLTECRQIITDKWGPDATGACWALIHERWHQFLFGFYPQDLYWRPVMSFFLLFAAITPVLFFGNRRTNLRVIGGAAILMIVALLLLTGAKGQVTAAQILFAVVVSAILLAVAYFKPAYLLWFTALYPAMTFWSFSDRMASALTLLPGTSEKTEACAVEPVAVDCHSRPPAAWAGRRKAKASTRMAIAVNGRAKRWDMGEGKEDVSNAHDIPFGGIGKGQGLPGQGRDGKLAA
jgi:hypothetical protein